MIRSKFFLGLLLLGLLGTHSLWAQGSGLTLLEGKAGRELLGKVIQSSPKATEFFASLLGINYKNSLILCWRIFLLNYLVTLLFLL